SAGTFRTRSTARSSARPAWSTAASWSARSAEVGPRQDSIEAVAQFVLRERAAFVRVPFGGPFSKGVFQLSPCERTIFVAIDGGKEPWPNKPARTEPAAASRSPASRRSETLWWRKHIAQSFPELFLSQLACLV